MKYMRLPLLMAAPMAYLMLCAFASAVLAYPLHFILPTALDFQTLVFKGAQLLMAISLFPFGRWLGMGKPDIGLAVEKNQFLRHLVKGFGYGALMLGLHVLLLLLLDVRMLDPEKLQLTRLFSLSIKGVFIGLAVALIEEPVFRGFLLGSLSLKTHRVNAMLISSFYFAMLHFLRTDMRPGYDDVHWDTGMIIALDAFKNLSQMYLDSFLALFTAGMLLSCIRLLSPSSGLGYCIGVHAGWVFILKASNPFGLCNLKSPMIFLVSMFDGNIGYFSAGWTSLLIIGLAIKLYRKSKATR